MDFFTFAYFLALKVGAFIYFFHDKQYKKGDHDGTPIRLMPEDQD